mgnify:CR=1 FL=1
MGQTKDTRNKRHFIGLDVTVPIGCNTVSGQGKDKKAENCP